MTIRQLAAAAPAILGDMAEEADGYLKSLVELSEIDAVQAEASGIDLAEPLKKGGVIYIVGSQNDEAIVQTQKMLLLRIAQLISNRPRDGKQRHATVFCDEVRYLVSKQLGDILGTIRDKGCNFILAHQSLDDLSIGDVESDAVFIDNTKIRWLYRSSTEKMAKWIAAQTGKILVNKTSTRVSQNEAGGDIGATERTISQTERFLYDENMVQRLPDGVAIAILGTSAARIAFASPIPVQHKYPTSDELVQLAVPSEPASFAETVEEIDAAEETAENTFLPPEVEEMEDGE